MATIKVLTKVGGLLEYPVLESTDEIFELLCGYGDINDRGERKTSRDYIVATKKDHSPIVLQKRFIFLVE